jgi:photosystem II Psb27 protein
MKSLLTKLFAVLLVAVIGLTGCSAGTSGQLTGNYQDDTLDAGQQPPYRH